MTKKRKATPRDQTNKAVPKKQKGDTKSKVEISSPDDPNVFRRTAFRFIIQWLDNWKDVVRIGMTCRDLYHFILNANEESSSQIWKPIHQHTFDSTYVPERIYPYCGK